jgi:molybdopterin molybdotransferase
MLSVDDAIQHFLKKATPIRDTEQVALVDAVERILAETITATIDVPPADNSAMDGYAINIQDLDPAKATTTLPISQTIAAGHPPTPLMAGTAARIFTGAEIPLGANAVVMQEQCVAQDQQVSIPAAIPLQNNIRPQGQDIHCGDAILLHGRRLQPQDIGLLASIGMNQVTVYRRLRVAILSTGDELVEPGKPLSTGKIYNSNHYLLSSFLQKMGIDTIDCGSIEDTESATLAALSIASDVDCIISTGGVSVGDEDHVKKAVLQLGELDFWRVAIKPGKPIACGKIYHGNTHTPFIGLPGNPASVFITFLVFARPFLRKQQHQAYSAPRGHILAANFTRAANPIRQEYLRGKINASGMIEIHPNQSSGVLSSSSWAEGLVVVPPQTPISIDDKVLFITFGELLNE